MILTVDLAPESASGKTPAQNYAPCIIFSVVLCFIWQGLNIRAD
jgi:hypothetical protein